MLLAFYKTTPAWVLMMISIIFMIIIIAPFIIHNISLIRFITFVKRLNRTDSPEELLNSRNYSASYLQRRRKFLERFTIKHGNKVIYLLGVEKIWIDQLLKHKTKKNMARVITHIPEKGIFYFFISSLKNRKCQRVFLNWFNRGDSVKLLYAIGAASSGIDFDGKKARDLLSDNIEIIRSMVENTDWNLRYFALKILLSDNHKKSEEFCWNSFNDSNHIIRKTIAQELKTSRKTKLSENLINLVLNDPLEDIRLTAYERLSKEFLPLVKEDPLFNLKGRKISDSQILHLIPFLNQLFNSHIDFALKNYDRTNLEVKYGLMRFLEKSGVLNHIFLNPIKNRYNFKKAHGLLDGACQVGISSFLGLVKKVKSLDSINIAIRVIYDYSIGSTVTTLTKTILKKYKQGDNEELYNNLFNIVLKSGNLETVKYLEKFLKNRKTDKNVLKLIINHIPEKEYEFVLDTLFNLYEDIKFPHREDIFIILKKLPENLIWSKIFDYLNYSKHNYPHELKFEMLELLISKEKNYCIESIGESLDWVSFEDRKSYSNLFLKFDKNSFNEKVLNMLKHPDSLIRSSIISTLTTNGNPAFYNITRKFLKDPDPQIRIAATWGLIDIGDDLSLDRALSMLSDENQKVRIEAARSLGMHGTPKILKRLKTVLENPDEDTIVKRAAIFGLSESKSIQSIDILLNALDKNNNLALEIKGALGSKKNKKDTLKFIRLYKDQVDKQDLILEILSENISFRKTVIYDIISDKHELSDTAILILKKAKYFDTLLSGINYNDKFEVVTTEAEIIRLDYEESYKTFLYILNNTNNDLAKKIIVVLKKGERRLMTNLQKVLKDLRNQNDKKIRQANIYLKDYLHFK